MSLYRRTDVRTLLSVGRSALHKLDYLIWPLFPVALVPSVDADQVKRVDYKLPALAASLPEDESFLWSPGDDPTPEFEMDLVDVSLSYKGRSTKRVRRDAVRIDEMSEADFGSLRFRDSSQILPMMLRQAALQVEASLYAKLSNTSTWATTTFTNGPLSAEASYSTQKPVRDIEEYLNVNMRPLAALMGYELWCVTNTIGLTNVALHPEYSGINVTVSAIGDARRTAQRDGAYREMLVARLKEMHGFSRVLVMDGIKTSAREGQSDSIGFITGSSGFFAIYLVKPGTFDHSGVDTPGPEEAADGALVLTMPKRLVRGGNGDNAALMGLFPDNYLDEEKKSEFFRVIWGHDWNTPRTNEGGIRFGVIFTNVTA
jgi:hypothetical protein